VEHQSVDQLVRHSVHQLVHQYRSCCCWILHDDDGVGNGNDNGNGDDVGNNSWCC